ncbi:hypoxanthine phosphoribosyltransferase [Sinorhizobium meliloti]|nr:putative hypoxanthine phosphoribosyltransferase [Sinorhizobium meliloti 2011]GEC39687.1 hypoxanthine phosphoribosyltransferase [Sinorhizobium meliloti]
MFFLANGETRMPVVRGKNIEVLYSAETIAARNQEMAADIVRGPHKDLLVISILKGSFIFAADLIRAMHAAGLAPEVEFITLSSYGTGTESKGVRITKDIDSDVRDRDVLLIDDILESGRTLRFAKELLLERGARNVTIAVLLDKRVKRRVDLEADYVGFECPDHFVVGYGMDVAYAFRELPFVGVVTGDAT